MKFIEPDCSSGGKFRTARARVVASSKIGILFGVRASLLARQILSTLTLSTDRAWACVGEVELSAEVWSGTGDEGWVKLPETPDRPRNGKPAPRPRSKGSTGPVSFELGEPDPSFPVETIIVRHRSGWMRADPRYLELRPIKPGKDGMPRWDLAILGTREDGTVGETAKGVYATGLGLDEYLSAGLVGIKTQELRDPDALPKTWKPGMVTTRAESEDGNGGMVTTQVERLGWVRGVYGIDKREVAIKVPMYGGGEWTDRRPRYHLTHLPSGYLIVALRRRKWVEEVADALVAQVAELGTGAEIMEGVADKVGAVIEAMKAEAGWQWDR